VLPAPPARRPTDHDTEENNIMSTPQLRGTLAATDPADVTSVRTTLLALATEASAATGLFLALLTALRAAEDTEHVDTALVGQMLERAPGRGLAYERLRACGSPTTAELLEALVRELAVAHAEATCVEHDVRTDLHGDGDTLPDGVEVNGTGCHNGDGSPIPPPRPRRERSMPGPTLGVGGEGTRATHGPRRECPAPPANGRPPHRAQLPVTENP